MLIILAIVILLISFAIAVVSMIREQREIENREERASEPVPEQSAQQSDQEVKPQAHEIDTLKSRIEELAREELAQHEEQPVPDMTGQITSPAEQQMLAEAQTKGQAVIEPKEVPELPAQTFGADSRFPNVAGTISVADLVKKRQEGKRV